MEVGSAQLVTFAKSRDRPIADLYRLIHLCSTAFALRTLAFTVQTSYKDEQSKRGQPVQRVANLIISSASQNIVVETVLCGELIL